MAQPSAVPASANGDRRLFWACFTALVATSFGFIARVLVLDEWGTQFGLSQTEKGEILGVGLWPFAVTIVLFSLIIDRTGYGKAMVFAFACHVASALVTMNAKGYRSLYVGTLIMALGNGAVEAVINPVVATLFSREKTKWLNMLHAGWPGGLVLGGVMALALGSSVTWHWKVGLIFIPTLLYAVLLLGRSFPVQERVAAGVSYRDMLKEAGWLGALIVIVVMVFGIGWWSDTTLTFKLVTTALLTAAFGAYVKSPGRILFIFLCLVMMLLATTELGIDSWVTPLMTPEMGQYAGWVIVYTSLIMTVLRFCAGPIVHKLSPLGLLAAGSAIAAVGLVTLSKASGLAILGAATLYGLGKTFFWPTMLGVVSERFPKGGALTLNAISGLGILAVGVIGNPWLGNIQDKRIESSLVAWDQEHKTGLQTTYVVEKKTSIFGAYRALDEKRVAAAPPADRKVIDDVSAAAKKSGMLTFAIFPTTMLACYLLLILYFRSRGGYQAVRIGKGAETE